MNWKIRQAFACLILIFNLSCGQKVPETAMQYDNRYHVQPITEPVTIDADWQKPVWRSIPALELKHYMGEKPVHRPLTRVKLAYDSDALYVIFKVEDQYVRAVADHYQDAVYRDSCVEFFFRPSADTSDGYFNLEMNCGGTALFHHQRRQGVSVQPVAAQDFARMSVAHSMPKIVNPEISTATVWTVEYRLPFAILAHYAPLTAPAPGVSWRANFYKCADKTSHPHWLTWAKIDYPKPRFHLPQFFGTLVFE